MVKALLSEYLSDKLNSFYMTKTLVKPRLFFNKPKQKLKLQIENNQSLNYLQIRNHFNKNFYLEMVL